MEYLDQSKINLDGYLVGYVSEVLEQNPDGTSLVIIKLSIEEETRLIQDIERWLQANNEEAIR